jgi:hypothetical protein
VPTVYEADWSTIVLDMAIQKNTAETLKLFCLKEWGAYYLCKSTKAFVNKITVSCPSFCCCTRGQNKI